MKNRLRFIYFGTACVIAAAILGGCGKTSQVPPKVTAAQTEARASEITEAEIPTLQVKASDENGQGDRSPAGTRPQEERPVWIDGDKMTLEGRFWTPEGYERIQAEPGSFLEYTRGMALKPAGSPVLLYDGREKGNQSAHAAVFTLPMFDSDLQQCADCVIRVYAEYLRSAEAYDKIGFHLTNGFWMDYPSWIEGNRLKVEGSRVSWTKTASRSTSEESFLTYLQYVMMYAGTLSLEQECGPVEESDIQPGDLFIRGGSPGHCVMVADMAENEAGEKCFLLAQGYMPSQDFHVLNNPLHPDDPWYYSSELSYPFVTPEYVFPEGSLKRWSPQGVPGLSLR